MKIKNITFIATFFIIAFVSLQIFMQNNQNLLRNKRRFSDCWTRGGYFRAGLWHSWKIYQSSKKVLCGDAGYVTSRSLFGFSVDDKILLNLCWWWKTYRMMFECVDNSQPSFAGSSGIYQKEIKVSTKDKLKKL